MIDYKSVGNYISEFRKINKLTQTQLAERLNMTHQAVSKWENGITLPDTETLFKLSKLFDVKIDDILSGKASGLNKNQKFNSNENQNRVKDVIKLEFGFGIIPYIKNIKFLEQIKEIRKRLEHELEREIPVIRIMDNNDLKDLQFQIKVKGQVIIKNDLGIVPNDDRVSEMLSHLEFVIKSYIDEISPAANK